MTNELKLKRDHQSRKFPVGYVGTFAVLTILNALFWLTVNFGSFVPPSDGTFRERFLMFVITEGGPISFLYLDWFNLVWTIPFTVGTIILLFLGRKFPKHVMAQVLAYLAILCWFLWGFSVAGIRIT